MKKIYIILVICICFAIQSKSQAWLNNLPQNKNGQYNFYDVKKAFNKYWSGKKIQKGKGWKVYKRWEDFMLPRVYPSGYLPQTAIYDAYRQFKNSPKGNNTSKWTPMGPIQVPKTMIDNSPVGVGRINCIAFHPSNPNILYCGSPSGGLWKSYDAGNSWATSTDLLPSIGVSSIAIDPTNPDIVYIATGDGDAGDTYSIGVLKSLDGGNTFTGTGLSFNLSDNLVVRKILIDPSNSSTLYAASKAGVYQSKDAGVTWSRLLIGNFKDIELQPGNSSTIYAASYPNAKIYVSTDAGVSFKIITNGLPNSSNVLRCELAVTPADPQVVYALFSRLSDDGFYGFYKSTDAGNTWTTQINYNAINLLGWNFDGSDSGGQGFYDLSLTVSPTNANVVFLGGVNIWRSNDGGLTWNINAYWAGSNFIPYVHADIHTLAFNNNTLYTGCDGGIYKTDDGGVNWFDMSDGISILQIYHIGSSVTNPDMVVSGNQDNGTFLRNGDTWSGILGGDGMDCIIDPTNADIIYGEYYNGDIQKSTNGGRTFTSIRPTSNDGNWVTPYMLSPNNPNIIYAGYDMLYKSTDGGNNWIDLNQTFSGVLTAFAVAPSKENFIYATTGSNLYATYNGGALWQIINNNLPNNISITGIVVSPVNPSILWVTMSGYTDTSKVFQSNDGGATWQKYSAGLPNVPVNCGVYENGTKNRIYVGTDLGVFYRDSTMNAWQSYNNGLPNVVVDNLEIVYNIHKLRAATYGRGLWQTNSVYDSTTTIIANFNTSTTSTCKGNQVTFTDNTFGVANSHKWDFGSDATPTVADTTGPINVTWSSKGAKIVKYNVSGPAGKDSVTRTINVVDSLTITVSPQHPLMCVGSSILLQASGAATYTWSPNISVITKLNDRLLVNPTGSTIYTVQGVANGCVGSAQVTVEINIKQNDNLCNAIPVFKGVNGPFDNHCATAQPNEPAPPQTDCNTQMSWCAEGGVQNSLWFSFIAPADSFVRIEAPGFDDQIAVYDANTCNDLFTNNYTLIAANDDYDQSDYSAVIVQMNLVAGRKYWLQVDGSAGGAEGTFNINVIHTRNPAAGIKSISDDNQIQVIPNPNKGIFTIKTNNVCGQFDVSIFNHLGTSVYENKNCVTDTKLDLSNLAKGVYVLKANCDKFINVTKLIIE